MEIRQCVAILVLELLFHFFSYHQQYHIIDNEETVYCQADIRVFHLACKPFHLQCVQLIDDIEEKKPMEGVFFFTRRTHSNMKEKKNN